MNSLKQKISESPFLRNFSLLSIGNFGTRFISMITNIIVARGLAPESFGVYSLVITYVSLLYFVASLGLGQLVIRSVSRNQGNSRYYFKISLRLRVLGFLISAVAFGIYGVVSSESFSTIAVLSILGGVFFESLWDAQQNIAFGMQRMEWNAAVSIGSSVLNLLICICLPKRFFTVNIFLIIYLAIYIVKNIVYYVLLTRSGMLTEDGRHHDIDFRSCVLYLKEAMPFYIMYLLGIFTGQLPILFLNHFTNPEQVAFFNVANKLLLPITLFMQSAFSAFFPNQSILFAKDRGAFSKQTRKVLFICTVVGVYFAVFVTLFKGEVVNILYGTEYGSASRVMALQCWYTVMYGIFCINGQTLGAADSQKKLAICSIVYAFVSTPILYFMSKRGAESLAMAFVIASIINLLYIMPVLKKTVGYSLTWKFSFGLVLGVIIMMTGSLVTSDLPLVFRIAIFVIVSILFVVLWKKSRLSVQESAA